MAEQARAIPQQPLKKDRQAMLVIHGIGEQNPYETLDSFARGVIRHMLGRGFNAKLCPIAIAHKDWTQVGMRIGFYPPGTVPPPCPPPGSPDAEGAAAIASADPPQYVDLFEYYWAPDTEDKLSAVQTLRWVLQTDLTPLRYFADNLQAMRGPGGLSLGSALWAFLKLYARELRRIIVLYLPLAAGLGLLLHWILKPHAWGAALKGFASSVLPYLSLMHSVILLLYSLFAIVAWFGWQAFLERKKHPGDPIDREADRVWLTCDVVLALILFAAALALDLCSGSYAVWNLLKIIWKGGSWQPLLGAAIAAVTSYALTAYVADVAVYVNTDAKSKNYSTRNAILAGSTAMLRVLLTCNDYDRVVLAGHSLGSVIAYDTINELLDQRNSWPGPPWDTPNPFLSLAHLQKLQGLVTFGSPLDKIYYFFREHVKRDQAIRAQILSMLHSFRKVRAGRDYGEFTFNYSFRQLDELVWVNAWARRDPVSGPLNFYDVNYRREFDYQVPVLAHLSYWGDPDFYNYFVPLLL